MTGNDNDLAAQAKGRFVRARDWATSQWERFERTRPGRAIKRYNDARGNVLAGGIAYHGLMSVAAGLVIASTVAALVVDSAPGVRSALIEFGNRAIPGLFGDGGPDGGGLIDPANLEASSVTGLASAVALLVLLFSATRYFGSLRGGLRLMVGSEGGNPLTGKLRDFAAFAAMLLLPLIAAGLQVFVTSAASALGADSAQEAFWVRAAVVAVTLLTDAAFALVALILLGRAKGPWLRIAVVAVAAAVVIGAMRLASSQLLGSAGDNPLLAPFAGVVTVLVWVDLVSRVLLVSGAWIGSREGSTPASAADAEAARG